MHPRRRLLMTVLVATLLAVMLGLLVFWVRPAKEPLNIAVTRPAWTVSLSGIPGDVAAVWIWTPRGSLLTNLTLPTDLQLGSSFLLVQASNRPGNPMKMKARRPDGASADIGWITTTNSAATFVSTMGRLIPGMGGYGATVAPFGSRPVFENPVARYPSGFEPDPDFPAAVPR